MLLTSMSRAGSSGKQSATTRTVRKERVDLNVMDRWQARHLADFFKLLGSPTTVRTIHALAIHGELGLNDVAEILGTKAEAIRNEMQRLVRRGLVTSRREGRRFVYRIARPAMIPLLAGSAAVARGPNANGSGRADPSETPDRMVGLLNSLAPRQQEVLGLLGDGMSVEDIGIRLGVTEATARSHVHGILSRLGVRSQIAAVAAARRHGFLI